MKNILAEISPKRGTQHSRVIEIIAARFPILR